MRTPYFLKISIFYFLSNKHSQNHNSHTNKKYPTQSMRCSTNEGHSMIKIMLPVSILYRKATPKLLDLSTPKQHVYVCEYKTIRCFYNIISCLFASIVFLAIKSFCFRGAGTFLCRFPDFLKVIFGITYHSLNYA